MEEKLKKQKEDEEELAKIEREIAELERLE